MQLEKIPALSYNNGLVREAAVDSSVIPQNTVEMSLNLHFDQIGAVKLRRGLTLLGTQVENNYPVLGMTNYRNNAGTNYKALAKVNTSVYAYDGSWSAVRSGLVAGSKARFTSLVDCVFMVNGNGNDNCSTYIGFGSFGSTNVASLPKGDFIENYRSRIWVADSATDKLYYTDVVTTSNTITGGTSYLQISPQDGESITGLKRHSRVLLVFKQNHIYRVFNINSTDPDPSILRGTYSQESIIEAKNGIYYHHPTGFYQFVFDGDQTEISRPIIDIIRAIPRSYYESVNGWEDEDHVYWSIGDITLEGISFSNIVCRYTLSTQIWTVYSYGSEIRSSALYDNGTSLIQLVGDDDGNVLQFDSGTTDNSSPIHYDLTTHWQYFTEMRSNAKTISEITTIYENANGGNISYQIDTDNKNKWRPISELKKDLYQVDKLNAKCVRIRFRLSGNSVGSPFIFRGWEVLTMLTEGEIKK